MVLPVCQHPTNQNAIICFDLSQDPLFIRLKVFVARKQQTLQLLSGRRLQ